ncbi:hypothetical protein Curi_c28950 [Gottschalkia acidurici 9a]|uniref:Uncharacterized protein n=1 Tax=Gottschalkia acidurici (strain ATCC 7906 / DSM 604 / BCRC 14475 / CIP 104303 / KCTC 5404 / NCIMB 10678 / 9a) TaxID=1128398 RepID=K0B5V1_GOTA9|nr:YkuS family protein [Gottschalkia acidurici]AFS79861.1 hypothetical protein Curi_c28950 [Gottschalkia acidurici 9a]
MKKNVLVQSDLENIKKGLNELGHSVVDMETGVDIDAIVYMADGANVNYHNQIMDVGENILNNNGAILINATGKTIEDIDNMINNKVYSPLGLRG